MFHEKESVSVLYTPFIKQVLRVGTHRFVLPSELLLLELWGYSERNWGYDNRWLFGEV